MKHEHLRKTIAARGRRTAVTADRVRWHRVVGLGKR